MLVNQVDRDLQAIRCIAVASELQQVAAQSQPGQQLGVGLALARGDLQRLLSMTQSFFVEAHLHHEPAQEVAGPAVTGNPGAQPVSAAVVGHQSWHLFGEDPSRRHRPTMVEVAHHLGIRVERHDIINIRPVRTGQRHALSYRHL